MADLSYSEKQSIKDSVKCLKKYGSTCNNMKRPEYYITHIVQKTDTLQGLALKYNTTVSFNIKKRKIKIHFNSCFTNKLHKIYKILFSKVPYNWKQCIYKNSLINFFKNILHPI